MLDISLWRSVTIAVLSSATAAARSLSITTKRGGINSKTKINWLCDWLNATNTYLRQKVIHVAKCAQRWETDGCKVSPIYFPQQVKTSPKKYHLPFSSVLVGSDWAILMLLRSREKEGDRVDAGGVKGGRTGWGRVIHCCICIWGEYIHSENVMWH